MRVGARQNIVRVDGVAPAADSLALLGQSCLLRDVVQRVFKCSIFVVNLVLRLGCIFRLTVILFSIIYLYSPFS